MFSSKQAALLFIQLLNIRSVCAATDVDEYREVQVTRGDTVLLNCNISETNLTMIRWTHGRFLFSYSINQNKTFSNFPLSRFIIDNDTPTTLRILDVQYDDAGLYTCTPTHNSGVSNETWNLTITEKQQQVADIKLQHIFYASVIIGLISVFILSAVCFYRKCGTRKANSDPSQNQPQTQADTEIGSTQLQGSTDQWRNKRQRREYMERLNSIYGDG